MIYNFLYEKALFGTHALFRTHPTTPHLINIRWKSYYWQLHIHPQGEIPKEVPIYCPNAKRKRPVRMFARF